MVNISILSKLLIWFAVANLNSCIEGQTKTIDHENYSHSANSKEIKARKVSEIPLPEGFTRLKTDTTSFENYLQNLPLNTHDNKIYSFDGTVISNENNHYRIIDIDIGTRDLQQCADAVIRLRAEYLFRQKKYNQIHFNFLSDGKPRYYNEYSNGDRTYKKFRKYLDYIFSYANSSSLKDEMLPLKQIGEMRIGDVFIQKGNPIGHAVIIVDMAENKSTGKKIMLIAQSYMPAQSIHILINPNDKNLSPWYNIDFEDPLTLPSWNFMKKDLRRFK